MCLSKSFTVFFNKKILFVFITYTFMGVLISLEGMINKVLSHYFGISLSYFVGADSLIIIIAVLFNYLYRHIAKRLQIRQILGLIFSLYICAIALILASLGTKCLVCYFASLATVGIPTGLTYPLVNNILYLETNNESTLFKAVCLGNAFWSMGFFIGSIIINALNVSIGMFYSYGFLIALSMIMIATYSKMTTGLNFPVDIKQSSNKTPKSMNRDPIFYLMALSFVILTCFQSLFSYWMPNYIKSLPHILPADHGLIIGMFGIGQFCTRLIFGFIYKTTFMLTRLIIALLITTSLSASLFILFHHSTIHLAAISLAVGLLTGPLLPAILSDVMSKYGKSGSQLAASNIILYGTLGNIVTVLGSSVLFLKLNLNDITYILPSLMLLAAIIYSIVCIRK